MACCLCYIHKSLIDLYTILFCMFIYLLYLVPLLIIAKWLLAINTIHKKLIKTFPAIKPQGWQTFIKRPTETEQSMFCLLNERETWSQIPDCCCWHRRNLAQKLLSYWKELVVPCITYTIPCILHPASFICPFPFSRPSIWEELLVPFAHHLSLSFTLS